MKCVNHPSVDSVAFCGQCGRPLCGACRHEVRGMAYCENCLAVRLQSPVLPPILGPGAGPSPGAALLLGFIPGVGAAYNGQVVKGLIQVLIFISLWGLAQHVDAFGFAVAAFWIYLAIDSYQTAKAKQLGRPAPEWFGLGDMKMSVPIGAGLLIVLGALVLLDNLGLPVLRHAQKFWPVLLILIGVAMLQRRFSRGSAVTPPGAEPPGASKQGPTDFPGPLSM